jgi:sortase A
LITQTPDRDGPEAARRRHPIWRGLETLLLIVGLSTLGYYLYVSLETKLYQEVENRELNAILNAPLQESVKRPRPLVGSIIGRIEIPRLGVSVIIRAGSDARTLRLAVGHIPGTALPGEAGNIGLAGHRDTFFRRLRDIRAGDEIRIVTIGGRYTFRVDGTRVVHPRDTWVLKPTPETSLTLVTCYPFSYIGSAPDRFIVRATARTEARQQS